jgi:hypothetical protein
VLLSGICDARESEILGVQISRDAQSQGIRAGRPGSCRGRYHVAPDSLAPPIHSRYRNLFDHSFPYAIRRHAQRQLSLGAASVQGPRGHKRPGHGRHASGGLVGNPSESDYDFADEVTGGLQAESIGCLIEGKRAIDYGLDAIHLDRANQPHEVKLRRPFCNIFSISSKCCRTYPRSSVGA